MKCGVLFMVSCILTFLVLSHVREVESKTKWGCDMNRKFPGTCGTNGKNQCISDIKKIPGAPKDLVARCECSAAFVWKGKPAERLCKCQYDC
ncbi:PREDICTED: defensin-like protein 226 [Camelina sativa]|uniref:Defensin-like protein 226 n=1 Tax=Camelina sativa TaxID=90675 RepID=A0ABM0Z781_CAMSA|nr:PREDICTED: defensin-like protein 226 [Camelina sativa]